MAKMMWLWNSFGDTVIFDSLRKSSLKWFGTICFVLITAAYGCGNHNENEVLIHDQGNRSWGLYHLNVNGSDIKISYSLALVYIIIKDEEILYLLNEEIEKQDFLSTWICLKNYYLRWPCKYLDDLIKNEFGQ